MKLWPTTEDTLNKNLTRALYALPVLALLACGKAEKLSKHCEEAIAAKYCDPDGKKCRVEVEISSCDAGPKFTPDTLYVCKKTTKITWTLSASASAADAKFAGNGIDFKGNPEFYDGHGTNTTFVWIDKHSKADADPPQSYGYGVHILKKDASLCYEKDPLVINE